MLHYCLCNSYSYDNVLWIHDRHLHCCFSVNAYTITELVMSWNIYLKIVDVSLCRSVNVMLWKMSTIFIDQWMHDADQVLWFSLPFHLWHRHCMVCFYTGLHTYTRNNTLATLMENLETDSCLQPCKKHSINVIWGKKEIKATSCFSVFQMLCFSLYYFVLFLVFPHPVPHSSPRIR